MALQEILDRRAARDRDPESLAERDAIRRWIRYAIVCTAFALLGIFTIGAALNSTDYRLARVLFWSGLAIGNGGILYTLLAAWRRGAQRRGW